MKILSNLGLHFSRQDGQDRKNTKENHATKVGLSSLGVPWNTQILVDQLTLFQPRGTDYAHLITTGTLGISDLPTATLKLAKIPKTKRQKFGLNET